MCVTIIFHMRCSWITYWCWCGQSSIVWSILWNNICWLTHVINRSSNQLMSWRLLGDTDVVKQTIYAGNEKANTRGGWLWLSLYLSLYHHPSLNLCVWPSQIVVLFLLLFLFLFFLLFLFTLSLTLSLSLDLSVSFCLFWFLLHCLSLELSVSFSLSFSLSCSFSFNLSL